MKKLSVIVFLVVGVAVFTSCKHDPPAEPASPEVVINNPPTDTVMQYHNGNSIIIDAELSDEDELHEAFVYVRTASDTMFSFDPYVHELPSYHLDTLWVVNSISLPTSGFVTIVASNHHEKITERNVPILLLP